MAQTASPQSQNLTPGYFPQAVFYQIFVRSFSDANGDGVGDLKGITAKWDYLRDLGAEAIWITPVFPSPSYHKYDVTNYYDIDPEYGLLENFPLFVADAHKNGFKIILDIPLNHCSVKHPWFMEASQKIDSKYRNCFLWTSNPPANDKDHWHLPKDEKGNPVGNEYYYGYFGPEMPDWNYDNPAMVAEAKKILTYWLTTAKVDGFRMDAAQHIFPEHAKNVAFWKDLQTACFTVNPQTFIVAEVGNTFEVIAPYLKSVDACFNFELASKILGAVKSEDATSFNLKMQKITSNYLAQNAKYKDAIFLTNHDQNRVMSEVGGNVAKAKLAAAILYSLPGLPFIYYGEELGMSGKKPDENIREPFVFGPQQEDKMRPSWIKPVYSTDKSVDAATKQKKDPNSFFNRYKELIQTRKNIKALNVGAFQPSALSNKKVLVFKRVFNQQQCLVLHNVTGGPVDVIFSDNEKGFTQVVYQTAKDMVFKDGKINLPAYSSVILLQPMSKLEPVKK